MRSGCNTRAIALVNATATMKPIVATKFAMAAEQYMEHALGETVDRDDIRRAVVPSEAHGVEVDDRRRR